MKADRLYASSDTLTRLTALIARFYSTTPDNIAVNEHVQPATVVVKGREMDGVYVEYRRGRWRFYGRG